MKSDSQTRAVNGSLHRKQTTTLHTIVFEPVIMMLKSPVALVTGCNSGIGKQIAIALASKDVTVLATARNVDSLKELVEQYPNIQPLPLSLNSNDSISALGRMVMDLTGGRLDILVNNAGTHYAATALDMDVEEAVKLFQVNAFAVMRLCKMFVPMLQKSPHGKIVQIGSVTRNVPVVWQSVYNASKAALSQYSKTLRLVSDLANGRHHRRLTKS
jgi:1-acylglycerone phosphate reductase